MFNRGWKVWTSFRKFKDWKKCSSTFSKISNFTRPGPAGTGDIRPCPVDPRVQFEVGNGFGSTGNDDVVVVVFRSTPVGQSEPRRGRPWNPKRSFGGCGDGRGSHFSWVGTRPRKTPGELNGQQPTLPRTRWGRQRSRPPMPCTTISRTRGGNLSDNREPRLPPRITVITLMIVPVMIAVSTIYPFLSITKAITRLNNLSHASA